MEPMSLNRYTKLLINNWKIIAYFMGGMLLISVIYSVIFFKPLYKSNAKLLLKETTPTNFITNLGGETQITSLGQNKNPILTQMEILSSLDLAQKVWDKIKKDSDFSELAQGGMAIFMLQNSVSLNNPPATDIIELSVKWDNPEKAQKITKAYVDAYFNYNVDFNKKSVKQVKGYIQKQLEESTLKLEKVREKIKNYRNKTFSVDLPNETASIVQQIAVMENQISDLKGQMEAEQGRTNELSSKLGSELGKSIQSIALGQNSNLSILQQKLGEAEQKFAELNVKYPKTNPQMKALLASINELKTQISEQTGALVGKTKVNKKNSLITDPVRTQMVGDLVKSQADLQSLTQQIGSLQGSLQELMKKQSQIPERQKTLANLLEEEKTLSLVVETLTTKLVEAQIKESEIISNVNIIESPTFPITQSFPTVLHLILIFIFIGGLLGVATVLGLYYIADTCQDRSEIEEILKTPVIGTIPWLVYNNYNKNDEELKPDSVIGIVYQKIATSLKVKCYKKGFNIIGMLSAEFEKRRPFISVNIAKTLASTDETVLLIDADFRDGAIAKELGIETSKASDITDCLLAIVARLGQGNTEGIEEMINQFVIPVPKYKNLFLLPNNNKIDNPMEILDSEAFPILMKTFKSKFDFVFVDTPPILAVPDSIVTAQYLDGLLILCGLKTPRRNLRQIQKICVDNYVELLGAITRDSTTELEIPENKYIKHLSHEEKEEEQVEAG